MLFLNRCLLAAAVVALLALLCAPVSASVIGIDYGAEWFKVSIVKTGVPLELVLNRESKRKTNALMTFNKGVRHFGSDAVALNGRFPKQTYPALKRLLGQICDSNVAEGYSHEFPVVLKKDAVRGTCLALDEQGNEYSVEELVGMQLAHAKEQAVLYGQESVSGAVITVPPYFNQFERQAILDAAELAKLNVLSLINDETAVAINYGMLRRFENGPEYHIFYDMGAGNTVASLIKFSNETIKVSKYKNKHIIQVEVVATAFDTTLGGQSIDAKIQKDLAEKFTDLNKGKLKGTAFDDPRAMAKFRKEANRIKHILSANTETYASIEGVMEDRDFKVLYTRKELEALSADLVDRVLLPINEVLEKANATMDKINSLVLVGGGVRVPFVQQVLYKSIDESKIVKNVNQDEAAVLGAGFWAATLSKQFKVLEISVKDINTFPIEVVYSPEPKGDKKRPAFHTTVFSNTTLLGAEKIFNFKRQSNFDFELAYKGSGVVIAQGSIGGIDEFVEKHKDQQIQESKIKLGMRLDSNGIVSIKEARGYFDIHNGPKGLFDSLKDGIQSVLGATKDDESGELPGDDVKTADGAANETEAGTLDSEKKFTTEKANLTVAIQWKTLVPLSVEEKTKSRSRLSEMDAEDARRKAREEARNQLETYIYSSKELLWDDDAEAVTTEEQRETLKQRLEEKSDWLDDEAEKAETSAFVKQKREIEDLRGPIDFRRSELRGRDEAVKGLRAVIENSLALAQNVSERENKLPDPSDRLFSVEEMEKITKNVQDAELWLNTKLEEQSKLKSYETPVLQIAEIQRKSRDVSGEVTPLLLRRPKPKKTTSAKKKTEESPKTEEADKTKEGEGATKTKAEEEETTKPTAGDSTSESSSRATNKDHPVKKEL
ncbi:Hsp70 protein-domain-containing protein [Polychytrium aggregatum]|uniref:Hsp70 protein-domain-containing protein n=1 Tax=Polychytrium aggregatum TaxID=110093 RepID=UPI0022FF3096|nr:Hsp70 protein-domain-containing protein [Polychytrium aggregatum]KAI9203941.1 Hsp70 protein-domain-containing protein [Polychytrium aggregatum]